MFGRWNPIWQCVIDHTLNNLFWALEGVVVHLVDLADNGEWQGDVAIAQVDIGCSIFAVSIMGWWVWLLLGRWCGGVAVLVWYGGLDRNPFFQT